MKRFAAAAFCVLCSAPSLAITVNYQNFSDLSGFSLNGQAGVINVGNIGVIGSTGNRVLRLTNDLDQSGSAFLTNAVTLTPEVSFSTFFEIQITDQQRTGADGIVFTVQTNANNVGGGGGGIGYAGITNSVGIEFDNWNNGHILDEDSANHVGINLNGSLNSVALSNSIPNLDAGGIVRSWVDYDGLNDLLEVRVSTGVVRPDAATLSYAVDLASILGTPNAFIGFTSGTGWAGADHDILRWVFNTDFNPIIDTENPVPEPSTLALIGLGLAGLGFRRRKRS